jgi:hypothetical protein
MCQVFVMSHWVGSGAEISATSTLHVQDKSWTPDDVQDKSWTPDVQDKSWTPDDVQDKSWTPDVLDAGRNLGRFFVTLYRRLYEPCQISHLIAAQFSVCQVHSSRNIPSFLLPSPNSQSRHSKDYER